MPALEEMTSSFSAERRRPQIGLDSLRLESAGRQRAMERAEQGVQMVRGDGSPEKGERGRLRKKRRKKTYRQTYISCILKNTSMQMAE